MQNKTFDFIGRFKYFISVSILIMLVGIVFNMVYGTGLSIDFKGGSKITYTYEGDLDLNKVKSSVENVVDLNVDVTNNINYTSNTKSVVITVVGDKSISTAQLDTVDSALLKDFPANKIGTGEVNSVDANVGISFFQKSLYALFLAAIFVIIYVGLRFKKIGGVSAAVTALIALVHDVTIVYFTDVILHIPLDDNFIAVVLTILGYSLNDTIVIYDRIRENTKLYSKSDTKMSIREIVNLSITQTFGRTLVTSLATFLSILSVTVVAAIAGLDSILSFSIPMSIGTIAGSYSTICLAGPLYVMWAEFKEKKGIGKNNKKLQYVNRKNPKKA